MSNISSTKPYLLRAIYEWCTDNGFTPYIAVKVQGQVHVPMEFVRDGNIVLDISFNATRDLKMDNEAIFFKARFGGVEREIYVPIGEVAAIYAGENNQGMAFTVVAENAAEASAKKDTTQSPSTEKPPVSLAVANNANKEEPPPDDKTPKGGRKKPSFTVIK